MDGLIVGSIAIDNIYTPNGEYKNMIGGSAVYASIAAAKFCRAASAGVIGSQMADEILSFLRDNNVICDFVEVKDGKTFSWTGKYLDDMNLRETISLDLGVFADFVPLLPEEDVKVVLLANISPELQQYVMQRAGGAIVMLDTMDHWIENFKGDLVKMLPGINLFLLNDAEAMLLTGEKNAVSAGKDILKMGPDAVIVKKGEHGALLFVNEDVYIAPAYPTANALDPTGAGDSFAGALLGRIALNGFHPDKLVLDMLYASATASICVEGFGPYNLADASLDEIESRVAGFRHALGCDL